MWNLISLIIGVILFIFICKMMMSVQMAKKKVKEIITLKVIYAKYDDDYIIVRLKNKENKYSFIEKYDLNKVIILDSQEEACVKKHFNSEKELLLVELFYNDEIL